MTSVLRLWLAFAALGAGVIHLAVGASAPFPLAITLAGLGIAELGWGIATLARGRLIAPQVTLVAALIPVFFWGASATLGSGFGLPADATSLPLFPMAVASLFNIFLSGALAVSKRRAGAGSSTPAAAADPQGWRFLTGLIIGGVLFSGLTTPALAATDAGAHAVPHGSHSIPGLEFLDSGHSDHGH